MNKLKLLTHATMIYMNNFSSYYTLHFQYSNIVEQQKETLIKFLKMFDMDTQIY